MPDSTPACCIGGMPASGLADASIPRQGDGHEMLVEPALRQGHLGST